MTGEHVQEQTWSCRAADAPRACLSLHRSSSPSSSSVTQGASAAWKIKRRAPAAGLLCRMDLMSSWKLSDEGLAEILIFVPLNVCVKVKQKVNMMTSCSQQEAWKV